MAAGGGETLGGFGLSEETLCVGGIRATIARTPTVAVTGLEALAAMRIPIDPSYRRVLRRRLRKVGLLILSVN